MLIQFSRIIVHQNRLKQLDVRLIRLTQQLLPFSQKPAVALRPQKAKSSRKEVQFFADSKHVRTVAGKGGNGCISFLSLWSNENAGPDGGDGGNGGHVIFEACHDVKNFNHITSIVKGEPGENGANVDCHGKNAPHNVVKVPLGTVIKNSLGKMVADLNREKLMFVAARGGSGGKGNHFFVSATEQAPQICEYGANGEDIAYFLELRSMAHFGFVGLPNAGKSTLLRAITRAKPKVAAYPFTTLKPHIGMIQYDDYEQIAVADLPGLIADSHKNRGLGIQFLKHAERCAVIVYVIDVSCEEPWLHYTTLKDELKEFSADMVSRPHLIVANKIDLPSADDNLKILKAKCDVPVMGISAKIGTNVAELLAKLRQFYDNYQKN